MSNTQKRNIFITAILVLFAFFAFGCKAKVSAEKIVLDLSDFGGQNIVLLLNESYTPKVDVRPAHATNRSYTITSENKNVIAVEDKAIKAVGAGWARIRISADDNPKIELVTTVNVRASVEDIAPPTDLQYNNRTKTISFSAVANAVSYTLSINDNEILLENATEYNLNSYAELAGDSATYDTDLQIKVKANVPKFGKAFNSLGYSNAISVYQTKAVDDVQIKTIGKVSTLTFGHQNAQNFKLHINGNEIDEIFNSKSIPLMSLPTEYAGQNVQLQIEALVEDESHYSSFSEPVSVYVLNSAKVNVKDNLITWGGILHSGGYDLFVDEELNTSVNSTQFNPANLQIEDYETHTLRVEPILSGNNLAKAQNLPESEIEFSFKQKPQIEFENGVITWTGSGGYFSVTILEDGEVVYGPKIKNDSSLEFNFQPNANYTVELVALGTNESDVYLFNSLPATQNVTKLALNNYALTFASQPGQTYNLLLDSETLPIAAEHVLGATYIDGILTANASEVKIDLSNSNLIAGEHNLIVKNTQTKDVLFGQFVQLEKILADIEIENSQASIDFGEINKNENIKFVVYSAQEVKLDNLPNNTTLNSTNSQESNFLPAGNYTIKAFVVGDGSSTFSVKQDGVEIAVAQKEFKVLPAPEISISNYDENPQITLSQVDGATEYKVFNLSSNSNQTLSENLSLDFTLNQGSIIFKAQAIGNGSTNLTSCQTGEFKITRLISPTLTYNKAESKFGLTDENLTAHAGAVKNYSITTDETTTINNINEFEYEFKNGTNTFVVKANAEKETEGEKFLNSLPSTLTISKIDLKTTVSVDAKTQEFEVVTPTGNFYNYLKVDILDAELPTEQYTLILKFDISNTQIEFVAKDGILKSEKYSLPYAYENGCYYIALLNENYAPIVEEISALSNGQKNSTQFNVFVKFTSDDDSIIDSDYSQPNEIKVLGQSSLTRVENEQQISIEKIDESRKLYDYDLLLDNLYQICLPTSEIAENVNVVDLEYIKEYYQNSFNAKLTSGEHSLRVITKNRAVEGLATLSQEFKFKLANELTLSSSKNETQQGNNSVVISFEEFESSYNKTYVVKLCKMQQDSLVEIQKIENTKTFNLDDYSFDGTIYVYAYVEACGKDNGIEVFNSPNSNQLSFTKINTVTNLNIINSILYFSVDEQTEELVAFYEIWANDGDGNKLLGSTPYKNYELPENFETSKLFVKAISKEKVVSIIDGETKTVYYSNSNLNETGFQATKISISANLTNGDFVITTSNLQGLYSAFENKFCFLLVKNGQDEKEIFFETPGANFVQLEDNITIYLEAYVVLKYSGNEKLTFQIKSCSETSFVNSSKVEIADVNGLKPLTDLRVVYSQTNASEKADNLTWSNPNPVANYTFVVVIVYEEQVLSSLTGTFYYYGSPISISNTGMLMPTSFKFYSEEEPILLQAGGFKISIKVLPSSSLGSNYASSNYAKTELQILNTPTNVSVQNGVLVWAPVDYAESYNIKIYTATKEAKESWLFKTIEVPTASFDFENTEFANSNGLLGFEVQAVSKKKNVQEDEILKTHVNSLYSEMFLAYRLPEVATASVDDGALVIKANEYFTSAEIVFVNVHTSVEQTFNFLNPSPKTFENSKQWDEMLTSGELDNFANQETFKNYYVKIDESEILNLQESDYTINVRLIGNTTLDGYLPLLSSKNTKQVSNLRTTKLAQNSMQTSKGEIVFGTAQEYEYNYNFSNLQDLNSLINAGIVYKISLTTNDANAKYIILALDYNYFKTIEETATKTTYDSGYFDLCASCILGESGNQLYLDVYKNNKISFKNAELRYHSFTVGETDAGLTYKTNNIAPDTIDLSGTTFEIAISILGGDSQQKEEQLTGYLTSTAVVKNFYRYKENVPYAQNGELVFENLIPQDRTDVPVYKIVCETADALNKQTFYVYYNNLEEAMSIAGEGDESKFFKISTVQNNEDLIYFEISSLLQNTNVAYTIFVQTLAGNGENSNWLDALQPQTTKTFYKLPERTFSAHTEVGLVLTTELSSINTSVKGYSKRYEVTLTDITLNDEPIVYIIDATSDGVEFRTSGGKQYLNYTLPQELSVNGKKVVLKLTSNYSIKIRPLADETSEYYQSMFNGEYTETGLTIKKQQGVLEQKIEGGVLKFKIAEENSNPKVSIKLTFEGGTITIRPLTLTLGEDGYYSYEFLDNYNIDNSGITTELKHDVDYTVQIAIHGYWLENVNIINSDYCTPAPLKRLQAVSNIVAKNGILTWDEIDGANAYEISVNGNEFETAETSMDLINNNLPEGELQISIKALSKGEAGDSLKIDAINSAVQTITKLGVATEFKIEDDSNTVTWKDVDGAKSYHITIKYAQSYLEADVNVAAYTLTGTGSYTLTVQAMGDDKLNGEIVEFKSSKSRPQPVENVEWDDANHRLVITPSQDFFEGDEIIVSFDITGVSGNKNETIKYSGQPVYYFYPTIIGTYTNINVTVKRMGGGTSTAVPLGKDVNFNIFSSGEGTQQKPYEIATAAQFKNINLFPKAYYKLTASIDLSSIESFGEYIIENFAGTLDGNSLYIYGFNVNNSSNFAIFKTLNNATIKQLTIGMQGKNSSITSTYSGLSQNQEIKLAILANTAEGSTLQNVNVENVTISVSGDVFGKFYLAGLINISTNTTIEGSNISININNFDLNSSYTKYVGGMVSQMNGGKIGSYNSGSERKTTVNFSFAMQNKQTSIVNYLGAVVAYANNVELSNIELSNLNLTYINAIYCGGIVGYVENNSKVTSCSVSGSISTITLSTNPQGFYIGGIAGLAKSVNINSCQSNVTLNVFVQNVASQICIGIYVGSLDGCTVDFKNSQTTVTTGKLSNFGNYGKQSGTTFGN